MIMLTITDFLYRNLNLTPTELWNYTENFMDNLEAILFADFFCRMVARDSFSL